ncbi:MAG: hypothetical protein OEM28_06795, partial [Nitrosopumilus sp.]|nr:hypothetical protein [Nitrosopumilus sp.]
MNNEIGRKITSLTLMTIMLAGGMVIAAPSMMPAAHAANANLFVSAENSQFDNYMSGPQVIEVVVIDSDLNDTNEGEGEPDVTVNGKELRMVQATDGNWYGYFADKNMALIADKTASDNAGLPGEGLDFGYFCSKDLVILDSAGTGQNADFSDTVGVAIDQAIGGAVQAGAVGAPIGGTISASCTGPVGPGTTTDHQNVLREAKQANPGNLGINIPAGQIGIDANLWPFIQLYSLNPTGNVVIQYSKGGGVQTTTLTFDTVDQFAGASLDRAVYTPGSQVHATITDLWLNIDPTDEDSWTFGTTGTGSKSSSITAYQVFDENGGPAGDSATNTDADLTLKLGNLMCEDNCRLLTNADLQKKGYVITLQDNDDSRISGDANGPTGFVTGVQSVSTDPLTSPQNPTSFQTEGLNFISTVPVTITEQGPNSGVFGSYDESDTSNIKIVSNAKRGTSASIDYNETPVTILVGLSFGSVDIMPNDDEWNSGEEIPIQVVDGDANKNSRVDEDLDLNDPNVRLLPALKTGIPATMRVASNAGTLAVTLTGATSGDLIVESVQRFSDRAILTPASSTDVIGIDDGDDLVLTIGTMKNFYDAAPVNKANFHGFALFNYDVRSLANEGNIDGLSTVDITFPPTAVSFTNQPLQGLLLIDDTTAGASVFGGLGPATAFTASFNLDGPAGQTILTGTQLPVVADVFGFGFLNDGLEDNERIASQIIRMELEETGDNTGIFAGTLEYTMINQLNILDSSIYENLSTIADDPNFIVIEDLDDEESPRVNYFDFGADGVQTQVADQEEAPAHSGVVSFDIDTYKTADTVNITLEDLDLNVDSDLIDIYTTVSGSSINALNDVVGSDANPFELSDGDRLGRVLDVTFDDQLWTATNEDVCTALLIADGIDTGLAATGFSLIETSKDSGTFVGDFQIPAKWCRAGSQTPETATGLDIEVNYVDFRDASGETIEVGDSAGIRASTGSVSLDRTVYPVPFGVPGNFGTLTGVTAPDNRSIFPIHATGINNDLTVPGSFLPNGDLIVHVRVNDQDFDVSASGEDNIAQNRADLPVGPVKISIIRGSEIVILGYAGGPNTIDGIINVGTNLVGNGMIDSRSELSEFSGGSGFTDGAVTITQPGVTPAVVPAAATFTNLGTGAIAASELVITNSDSGFGSGVVTITQGASTATATFTDVNGDTNVEANELLITNAGSGFTTGTVTITQGVRTATATFTDDTDSIDSAAELTITPPLPSGANFVSGTVTITQGAATADATFTDIPTVTQFGPMDEIAPDAGIFETDLTIQYTDGPSDSQCPTTTDFDSRVALRQGESTRFSAASPSGENYCILQGDILQVEYTDPADASGDVNTVTDSATFDLRNGVLQSDKSVYIIGSDMILTLIEPDLDLDNDQAETWDLDLIEWDSDAATVTMGDADGEGAAFDPEPLNFRETGDSTGIFQIIIEIPEVLANDRLERGEEIVLEYTDWGPSGSDFVGDEDEDINLTLFTSNFGATVELDQKVYTWTDKVYITIVAPDHNFDSNLVDEIGNTDLDPIKVSTRGSDIDNYKLVETGTDTGIFTGEVILTGFTHDADGDSTTGTNGNDVVSRAASGVGPTDGLLPADDDDGLTVSFEFSEDETVVGSSLIRWNIGEVQWLEASYPASGTGVVRVIDPDMNLDPEAVDNFDVDVWSDSDAGGIDLTVTETNEATGIYEGTVFFTVTDESSGHRLRVAEGDTVTAEYEDNTLPDPYTTADELDITATSLIGTVVPPLERAPAANLRTVDAFGNSLDTVSVDQQVQISADLANGQDREQSFAYLVQIQDGNGVTVALAWITGSLSSGQSFSPALSWIPTQSG